MQNFKIKEEHKNNKMQYKLNNLLCNNIDCINYCINIISENIKKFYESI